MVRLLLEPDRVEVVSLGRSKGMVRLLLEPDRVEVVSLGRSKGMAIGT